jgi:RHS repeat-associated protein
VRESPSEKQLVAPKFTLVIYRARYYDPETGEFASRDPLEYVDGMSLYRGYFALGKVDPSGTEEKQCETTTEPGCLKIKHKCCCKPKCEVEEGPEITLGNWEDLRPKANLQRQKFDFTAKFKNDPANCIYCACCEVRLYIQWSQGYHDTKDPNHGRPNGGPPHGGFKPPQNKPDTWYEDRGNFGKKYGYRCGANHGIDSVLGDGYGNDPGPDKPEDIRLDQTNGCKYRGTDFPSAGYPGIYGGKNASFKFRVAVRDTCQKKWASKGKDITINWK